MHAAVIGYVRVSSDEQVEGFGLAIQEDAVRAFCKRERLKLVSIYADPGVSGTLPLADRPGLARALDHVVARGGVASLVVARFDRLARDTLQALLIERAFQEAGAPVLYAEGMNGKAEGVEFMRTVMHAMAQEQKRQTVARLNAGKRKKAEAGGYAGGRPAFGYEARDGMLYPSPAEAEAVRWIFGRVARDGASVRRVAAELDRAGTCGKRWHPTDVRRILHRVDYKSGPVGSRVVDPKVWNRAAQVLAARRPR